MPTQVHGASPRARSAGRRSGRPRERLRHRGRRLAIHDRRKLHDRRVHDRPALDRPVPDRPALDQHGAAAARPAELLDAELVYFDADGQDNQREDPAPGRITDASQLAAFQARYVDGDPALPAAAAGALAAGDRVLIGGVVSSGCFPADYARLALMDGDVRVLGMGGRVAEPNTECVRVITSVGLVSVRAADLPAGATVQGT